MNINKFFYEPYIGTAREKEQKFKDTFLYIGNSKNREFATREEVLKRVEEKGAKLVITQSGKK